MRRTLQCKQATGGSSVPWWRIAGASALIYTKPGCSSCRLRAPLNTSREPLACTLLRIIDQSISYVISARQICLPTGHDAGIAVPSGGLRTRASQTAVRCWQERRLVQGCASSDPAAIVGLVPNGFCSWRTAEIMAAREKSLRFLRRQR